MHRATMGQLAIPPPPILPPPQLHSTSHEYGSFVSVHTYLRYYLGAPSFQVVVTGNDIHPNTDMCSHSLNRARIYAIVTCSDIIILIICVHILRWSRSILGTKKKQHTHLTVWFRAVLGIGSPELDVCNKESLPFSGKTMLETWHWMIEALIREPVIYLYWKSGWTNAKNYCRANK